MPRWRASSSVLLALLPALLAAVVLARGEPVQLRPVACFDSSKAVLGNGTVLALPTLERLADIGPVDGCDIGGEVLAAWRAGRVTVYKGSEPAFSARGERAFAGPRFVMVLTHDSVAVYSVYGFEVFRLSRYTSPAAVWVLAAQKSGSKAVVLVSPTTCRVRMQVESYLLVYDLGTGLYSIYQTGAVSFIAVPSGALWVKNGTLCHNGREVGKAPGQLYPVQGFDGYASVEGSRVVVHGFDGSRFELPMPPGRGLAVSRLQEGFVVCTDAACACTFECAGFSELAYQAFTPLTIKETTTHFLLHGGSWLFVVEKPKALNTTAEASPTGNTTAVETPGQVSEPSQPPTLGQLAETSQPPEAPPTGECGCGSEPSGSEPVGPQVEQPAAPPGGAEPRNASVAEHGLEQLAEAPAPPVRLSMVLVAAGVAAVVLAAYLFYRRRYYR